MRTAASLAIVAAIAIPAAALAATTGNSYVVKATVTPVKSGTAMKPVPVGAQLQVNISAAHAGSRPAAVKTYRFAFQGIRENTNSFPACGTSRLTDPTEGPTTCPKGSQIGTGYFIADVGPSTDQTVTLTCRAELTVYNGGNHSLSLYVYAAKTATPAPCPLAQPYAVNAHLKQAAGNLVETFDIPAQLQSVTVGGKTLDVGATTDVVNLPVSKLVKSKKVHGKTVKQQVGLFESVSCPPNHQRHVGVTFTDAQGAMRTATRLVACR